MSEEYDMRNQDFIRVIIKSWLINGHGRANDEDSQQSPGGCWAAGLGGRGRAGHHHAAGATAQFT